MECMMERCFCLVKVGQAFTKEKATVVMHATIYSPTTTTVSFGFTWKCRLFKSAFSAFSLHYILCNNLYLCVRVITFFLRIYAYICLHTCILKVYFYRFYFVVAQIINGLTRNRPIICAVSWKRVFLCLAILKKHKPSQTTTKE